MAGTLSRLYAVRFVVAIAWAAVLALTAPGPGPLLTALVVVYPLVDAAAVLVQLRTAPGTSRVPETVNLVLSLLAAIALGIAAVTSVGAVLTIWGVWAIASGATQFATAILRRTAGGQIPLIVSGAISLLAGAAFTVQGAGGGTSATGIAGYATLGGVFFLIAGIRLAVLHRRGSTRAA
jgi:uncharacterized membrane protein HdeD (DUF308 family)